MDANPDRALERRTQTICLMILTAVAIGFALAQLKSVLVPFVLALFLTVMVTPAMDWLRRRLRFPRWLAIAGTLVLALVALLLVATLVSTALGDFVAKQELYQKQVDELWDWPAEKLDELLASTGTEWGREVEVDAMIQPAREKLPGLVKSAIGWTVNAGFNLISSGFLVLLFMMFLILGHRPPGPEASETIHGKVRVRVIQYLRVKVLVSALTGVGIFSILKAFGVELALVFGLMTFLLNFIPSIGSIVAVLLPLPVVMLTGDLSVASKIVAVALMIGVQVVMGNVLEPRWTGKSLDLNPIVVMLALIFWGFLWGPIGMLLSVPLTSALKILLEQLPYTRPVAAVLSDSS